MYEGETKTDRSGQNRSVAAEWLTDGSVTDAICGSEIPRRMMSPSMRQPDHTRANMLGRGTVSGTTHRIG
jgi:hypothetical protein